jgi:hypothetical protein
LSGGTYRAVRSWAAVVAALALAMAVTACGDSSSGSNSSSGDSAGADAITSLYAELQDDFDAGDGEAFCKSFGSAGRSLDEFDGELVARRAQCAFVVERVARMYSRGDTDWPAHEIGPVTFPSPGVAFLELRDADGGGFLELQFTKRGDTWTADFSVPDEL